MILRVGRLGIEVTLLDAAMLELVGRPGSTAVVDGSGGVRGSASGLVTGRESGLG